MNRIHHYTDHREGKYYTTYQPRPVAECLYCGSLLPAGQGCPPGFEVEQVSTHGDYRGRCGACAQKARRRDDQLEARIQAERAEPATVEAPAAQTRLRFCVENVALFAGALATLAVAIAVIKGISRLIDLIFGRVV